MCILGKEKSPETIWSDNPNWHNEHWTGNWTTETYRTINAEKASDDNLQNNYSPEIFEYDSIPIDRKTK